MYNYLMQLAEKYNMPFERVISIALNRYGILIPNIPDNRLRFNLKLLDSNETNYYAVCINTYLKSPFTIKKGNLMLENIPVGIISNIEKDTCLSTYFRNNKKAITFNSNSRSKCIGCKFCGTYSLSDDDVIIFDSKEKVQQYFNNLLHKNQIATMGDIEDITICTGCFENENITHVDGSVDPLRDIETIELELIFADIESVQKRAASLRNAAKGGDKKYIASAEVVEKIQANLEKGIPVRLMGLSDDEKLLVKDLCLLTQKPVIYAANIAIFWAIWKIGTKYI